MEVFLIRHTAVAVERSVCYGQSDVPLADTFPSELEGIRRQLHLQEDCVVYASPLSRSLKLAQAISPSAQVMVDVRLMELNFGDWELKKWDEIDKEELNRWMDDFVNVSCSGGESYAELYQRCAGFFHDCIRKPHPQAVIVTHGGVIRSILSLILQIPLINSFSLQIDYGKISKVNVKGNEHYTIEYINH